MITNKFGELEDRALMFILKYLSIKAKHILLVFMRMWRLAESLFNVKSLSL